MAAASCSLPGRPGPPPGLVETASQNRRLRRHQNTHDQGNEIKEMMQNISNEHCNYAKDLAQMTQRFDKISIWLPEQINEILERLALLERVFVFVDIESLQKAIDKQTKDSPDNEPDSELSPLKPTYDGHSSAVACREQVNRCIHFDIEDDSANNNNNLSDSPFDNFSERSEEQEDEHSEEDDRDQNDENQAQQRQGNASDHELMEVEVNNVFGVCQREEHDNEYDARPRHREDEEDEVSQEMKREQGVQQDGLQDEEVEADRDFQQPGISGEVKTKRQEMLTAAQLSEMMALIMSISAKMDNTQIELEQAPCVRPHILLGPET